VNENPRLRIDEHPGGELAPGPLELSDLTGCWVNTDQHVTGRVLRMEISDIDGELRVRGFGSGDTEPRDWGEVAANALVRAPGERAAWGFWCRFDLDTIETDLAAYYNSGVIVVASFNRFGPSSGRTDFWKREFFYREDDGAGLGRDGAGDFTYAHDRFEGGRPIRPPVNLAPILGTWVGFSEDLAGITEVELGGDDDEGAWVRLTGSGDLGGLDWGRVPAQVFTDDAGRQEAFAFRAAWDHEFERVELFAYLNRRVLIAEVATEFTDLSGRRPYYVRNFYRCR
jgi:hypothetical protein